MATMDVMRGPGMERLSHGAKEAANHPWAKKLGRMGYAAKGAVYAIIGVLALKLAAGEGGRTTDSHGAVEHRGARALRHRAAVACWWWACWASSSGASRRRSRTRRTRAPTRRASPRAPCTS